MKLSLVNKFPEIYVFETAIPSSTFGIFGEIRYLRRLLIQPSETVAYFYEHSNRTINRISSVNAFRYRVGLQELHRSIAEKVC